MATYPVVSIKRLVSNERRCTMSVSLIGISGETIILIGTRDWSTPPINLPSFGGEVGEWKDNTSAEKISWLE